MIVKHGLESSNIIKLFRTMLGLFTLLNNISHICQHLLHCGFYLLTVNQIYFRRRRNFKAGISTFQYFNTHRIKVRFPLPASSLLWLGIVLDQRQNVDINFSIPWRPNTAIDLLGTYSSTQLRSAPTYIFIFSVFCKY